GQVRPEREREVPLVGISPAQREARPGPYILQGHIQVLQRRGGGAQRDEDPHHDAGGKLFRAAAAIRFSWERSESAPITAPRPGIALPNSRTERRPKRRSRRPPIALATWDCGVAGGRAARPRVAAPETGPSATFLRTDPDSSPSSAASTRTRITSASWSQPSTAAIAPTIRVACT